MEVKHIHQNCGKMREEFDIDLNTDDANKDKDGGDFLLLIFKTRGSFWEDSLRLKSCKLCLMSLKMVQVIITVDQYHLFVPEFHSGKAVVVNPLVDFQAH